MNERTESGERQQRLDTTRQDEAVVTRSEEELVITTQRREARRARLTKFVESELETITVPVLREQVRIDYEPTSDGNAQQQARSSVGSVPTAERWMVLYAEEVVVQTRWVARERVRLETFSVIGDQEISEELRSEQIEIDDTTNQG